MTQTTPQGLLQASPSPRRAWIEISFMGRAADLLFVALPTEGVD